MSNDIGQFAEMFDSMLTYRIDVPTATKAIKTVRRLARDETEANTVIAMLGLDEYLPSLA